MKGLTCIIEKLPDIVQNTSDGEILCKHIWKLCLLLLNQLQPKLCNLLTTCAHSYRIKMVKSVQETIHCIHCTWIVHV